MFLMQNVGCLAIDNKGSGKQVMVLGMFYDDKGRAQLWKWGQVQWWGRGGLGGFGDCAGQSLLQGI
jgi:hypothetical protein